MSDDEWTVPVEFDPQNHSPRNLLGEKPMSEVSIRTKIEQLSGMAGTDELTAWEKQFVTDMQRFVQPGAQTSAMSEKQVSVVDRLWRRFVA